MPKAILEFDLEDENDLEKFKMANNARDYWIALHELTNFYRKFQKHRDNHPEAEKAFDEVSDWITNEVLYDINDIY